MNRSTTTARIRRVSVLVGAAGALTVLAPTAAHAGGWGGTLVPGQTQCYERTATSQNYQVRGEGTATRKGARFSLTFDGYRVLDVTPVGTVSGWAAERRSAYGNYPGPGVYKVCATNENSTNTLVNIHLLFDNEFI